MCAVHGFPYASVRLQENVSNIDAIMMKFDGREEALWTNLLRKYPTRLVVVDEDDMMTDPERLAEQRKKDKEEAMAKAAEKLAGPPQSHRWKTEVCGWTCGCLTTFDRVSHAVYSVRSGPIGWAGLQHPHHIRGMRRGIPLASPEPPSPFFVVVFLPPALPTSTTRL